MAEYRSEQRENLDGIRSVSIFNPVGRIAVTGWDKPDLLTEFTVNVAGDTGITETYHPRMTRSGDCLTIRPPEVVMAGFDESAEFSFDFGLKQDMEDLSVDLSEFVESVTQFAKKSFNTISSGLNTSMEIHLPRQMALKIRNLNGVISVTDMHAPIRAKGLNGPVSLSNLSGGTVTAQTINGPVSIDGSSCSDLTLKSVNGPVKCYLNSVQGPVNLKTVNGPVRLMLPQTADVSLTAGTVHGAMKISGNFVPGLRTSRKIQSVLNSGTHDIQIKTTAGAITVITSEETRAEPGNTSRNVAEERASGVPLSSPGEPSPESQANTGGASPESLIERMVASGKITPDEAERLRKAI